MKRMTKQLRGSALVFSLLVLSILLAITISSTVLVFVTKNSTRATERSIIAFQIADGATENILKRAYKNTDANLNALAGNLYHSGDSPVCSSGIISGALPSSSGTYTVKFFDNSDTSISCSDGGWRTKLVYISATGMYAGTTRAIKVGVKP